MITVSTEADLFSILRDRHNREIFRDRSGYWRFTHYSVSHNIDRSLVLRLCQERKLVRVYVSCSDALWENDFSIDTDAMLENQKKGGPQWKREMRVPSVPAA